MVEQSIKGIAGTKVGYINAVHNLQKSLDKAYELYHLLLMLPVELTRMQDLRLDNARNKYLPTHEDLNPNLRFIDNRLIPILADNEDMHRYLKENPIDLSGKYDLLKSLLDNIVESDVYAEYMNSDTDSLEADCEFWRTVFRTIILPSDALAEALESDNVFWNDDLDIIGTFVLKTIRRIGVSGGNVISLLPQYKDDEDARFGADLFESAVERYEENMKLIERFVDARQWDPERLAFMDVVIMMAAITELVDYPLIPIPVTLNEYIEIANYYSTPRSGQFINGILFSVINYLKKEGVLVKN
ncbi:MAG: transcription antitermination factor NusB [Paramuribaculum sp.]|nr:transcription antitermination factor NusB [Paramuribaculum sp.]